MYVHNMLPVQRGVSNWLGLFIVAVSSWWLQGTLQATLVFNSFGPDSSFLPDAYSTNWTQFSYTETNGKTGEQTVVNDVSAQSLAVPFAISGHSYIFDALTLALWKPTEAENINLVIKLVADKQGYPTGAVLEILAIDPLNITSPPQASTYSSRLHPLLTDGSIYWVVVEAHLFNLADTSNNSNLGWNLSPQCMGWGASRHFNADANGWGSWTVRPATVPASRLPAMSIEAMAIPEPQTWGLVVFAALFVFTQRRPPKAMLAVALLTDFGD